MHAIVFSDQLLARQYGESGARRIRSRVATLAQARSQRGLSSALLDVEQGLDTFGVPPADARDAAAVRRQLIQLADGLELRGEALESVLLIGGPHALPFHHGNNPLADPDDTVPADYPYGARKPGALTMNWPVGRLPGGDRTPETLLRLLGLACWHQRGVPSATRRTFGYSTESWQPASSEVFGALNARGTLVTSPPTHADSLNRDALAGAAIIYCNLHGVREGPRWYGQGISRRQVIVALRPQDLAELPLLGAIVCSEACYGAHSASLDFDDSLAMRFLLRGALGFLGATTITYGSAGPPLSGADLLAARFLQAVQRPGAALGAALQQARREMLDETLRRQRFLDEDDIKTLAQFVLYGDPTLTV
jgi:hypothetical protein